MSIPAPIPTETWVHTTFGVDVFDSQGALSFKFRNSASGLDKFTGPFSDLSAVQGIGTTTPSFTAAADVLFSTLQFRVEGTATVFTVTSVLVNGMEVLTEEFEITSDGEWHSASLIGDFTHLDENSTVALTVEPDSFIPPAVVSMRFA